MAYGEHSSGDDSSARLQSLLDRANAGDHAVLSGLVERAHDRLRRMAGAILRCSFPRLEARHELDSVLHEAWPRIERAVEQAAPPTVADFVRLAAFKVRQVLLELAEKERLRSAREVTVGEMPDRPVSTDQPERLALWTEIHDAVGKLPDDQRRVFEAHYYLGLSQAEIARLFGLSPRKVSYLWVAGTEALADLMLGPDFFLDPSV